MKQPCLVAINGSPRRQGNCDTLLGIVVQAAAAEGARTELIQAGEVAPEACRACSQASGDGRCRFDGGFQIIYERICAADALVVASPVYFGSVSAQLKAVIDRFQCHWQARQRGAIPARQRKRPGAFVCVQAAGRREFFENARFVVRQFFATVDTSYSRELFCPGVDAAGSISRFPDMLAAAADIGRALVAMCRAEQTSQ
ncbi:MAG: flavodoxin family protein [Candidatus Omnitrophica bacterium]|nr:flavodoxin family protein [Candidatus Omnitrophota bacterium]